MSEEKLTVAELMARAAKEGHSSDAPRRRRRRSLDDGGISVAELTGSIPAVKDKPIESRHSSVPIDTPDAPPAKAVDKPVEKPVEKPAEEKLVDETPAPRPAEIKAVDKQPKAGASESDAPARSASVPRSAPSDDETMVLSIVDEKDPIRLTTGAFPVVPASAVKPAAPVKAAAGADKDAQEAADAEFAAGEPAPVQVGTAQSTVGTVDTADTEVSGAVDGSNEQDHAGDSDENSGKMSVFAVIVMAVVGIVLGVVVFLAFEMLWERLENWIVALLAVAVTLGMIGIVHALRTSRDGFSMVLAGIVGLVMTFGPLATIL